MVTHLAAPTSRRLAPGLYRSVSIRKKRKEQEVILVNLDEKKGSFQPSIKGTQALCFLLSASKVLPRFFSHEDKEETVA